MRIRNAGVWLVLMLASSATALSQPSTDKLGSLSSRSLELAAGMELKNLFGSDDRAGRVLGVHLGLRTPLQDSPAGLKLSALWLNRSFSGTDQNGQRVTTTHSLLGFTASADVEMTLGPTTSLAPSVGLGLAPHITASGPVFPGSSFSSQGSGTLWMASLTLRGERFLIQQHLIALLGADNTIQMFREYLPLMIGWRF